MADYSLNLAHNYTSHLLDFSIIIVNYNTCNLLEACLNSIYQSQGKPTFEIIVIDNNSQDGSVAMVRSRFEIVKVISNNENQGFAKACNQGIRIAHGNYILLLNSDTEVFPDTFEQLKQFLDNEHTDSKIGIVGCKIMNTDNTLQYSIGKFPTIYSTVKDMLRPPHKRKYCLDGYDESHEVDWVTGAFMLVDQRIIHDVGLLDERYFMYYEDVDWCLNAKNKGWKVFYYSKAKIIHKTPHAFKKNKASEKVDIEIRKSHLYYYRKNHTYLSFLILSFTTIILLLLECFFLWMAVFIEEETRQNRKRKTKLLLLTVWDTFWNLKRKVIRK